MSGRSRNSRSPVYLAFGFDGSGCDSDSPFGWTMFSRTFSSFVKKRKALARRRKAVCSVPFQIATSHFGKLRDQCGRDQRRFFLGLIRQFSSSPEDVNYRINQEL